MINPITPEFVLLVHNEKVRELERGIALDRFEKQKTGPTRRQSRTARAAAWMRERVLRRATEPQLRVDEPCPTVPC